MVDLFRGKWRAKNGIVFWMRSTKYALFGWAMCVCVCGGQWGALPERQPRWHPRVRIDRLSWKCIDFGLIEAERKNLQLCFIHRLPQTKELSERLFRTPKSASQTAHNMQLSPLPEKVLIRGAINDTSQVWRICPVWPLFILIITVKNSPHSYSYSQSPLIRKIDA